MQYARSGLMKMFADNNLYVDSIFLLSEIEYNRLLPVDKVLR